MWFCKFCGATAQLCLQHITAVSFTIKIQNNGTPKHAFIFLKCNQCFTVKIPNIYCNHTKSWTRWHFLRVMHPKDAEGIANSVDPDRGPVWPGSALFAQTCLSENLGKLRCYKVMLPKVQTKWQTVQTLIRLLLKSGLNWASTICSDVSENLGS